VRILLLNQFYPPDVAPTGQFLGDLAAALAARGHEVHVACSRRSYDGGQDYPPEEVRDGAHVHRLPGPGYGRRGTAGRIADYAAFAIHLVVRGVSRLPRPDLVLSLTTPPYLGLLGMAVARARGARHAHWIMDVYPGVLAAHGMLRPGGVAFRTLRSVAAWPLRRAAFVLTLGPFMARVLEQSAPGSKPTWVPLWGAGDPCSEALRLAARRARGWSDEDLVLLYSGNMGLGHRFTEFLEAAVRLGERGPVWAFAGGGARRGEIEDLARRRPEARVRLLPYVPLEELMQSLGAADVHLVSLSRAWQGLIVPSKIQGIFSSGRPALFVGPEENGVAAGIRESGGGWVVAEGDVPALLAAIDETRDPAERRKRGEAALAFARSRFDRARNVETIARLVETSLDDA